MAMPYRMMRLALRPQRSERNAMIFNSRRLPRSRWPTHSAGFGVPSRGFVDLRFMQRAAGNFAAAGADGEMDQPGRRRLVLEDEAVARPYRIEKFCRRDVPGFEIYSARQFDGLEHLVQQDGSGQ